MNAGSFAERRQQTVAFDVLLAGGVHQDHAAHLRQLGEDPLERAAQCETGLPGIGGERRWVVPFHVEHGARVAPGYDSQRADDLSSRRDAAG